MRILIAPDSFKECLSAVEVAEALAVGARRALPDATIDLAPIADGGEGTVDALVHAAGGVKRRVIVTGPLGNPVEAAYGILDDAKTAVIETAAASGLALVPKALRDPRIATSRGTGELMRHALENGARIILVGLGGSAINDGGAGMAQALGYRLLDAAGNEIANGGAALSHLDRIDATRAIPELAGATFIGACDVENPLCGPDGASFVYGPQKGATPAAVVELDAALNHLAAVIRRDLNRNVASVKGAGAAGGLGAGLMAFCNAQLKRGFDVVADACRLDERIEKADLVITGEGALDRQTVFGKAPAGICRLASKRGIPVVGVAGRLDNGYQALYEMGLTAAFSISPRPMTTEETIARAAELLADTAETIVRFWAAIIRSHG